MLIYAHVHEKTIPISCGPGVQPIKWLGHVGIARYDDKDFQGWKELGVPTKICLEDGEQLPMTDAIQEHLETGAHVFITPSLKKRPLPTA